MSKYKGKELTVRRNGWIAYADEEIGCVYPDPGDHQVNCDWVYTHASGTTLKDVHPTWEWPRTVQGALTKRDAARGLADLHLAISAAAAVAISGTRLNGLMTTTPPTNGEPR